MVEREKDERQCYGHQNWNNKLNCDICKTFVGEDGQSLYDKCYKETCSILYSNGEIQ